MPVFEELPDDGAFRVIKWFDRFTLPHAGTRSAAVDVLFQRIALPRVSALNRLSETDVQAIVGRVDRASGSGNVGADEHYHPLAGYVPHFRIGHVYEGRAYVGQLPAVQRHIELPSESLCTETTMGSKLPPPIGWKASLPYRPVAAKQYALPLPIFGQSKCLYFLDDKTSTEYIIPRPVIFQTFYAAHSALANAFTSGPWETTARALISESNFKSGLKTQIDPETGSWDLVLTPRVPEEDLARILALYWFDPYARKCADNIYTAMLKDWGRDQCAGWFASAEVPFRLDNSTLALGVRGFNLAARTRYDQTGSHVPHHTFLVTSISSFPWPSWAPVVRWEKTNSGAKGKTQTWDPGPHPYGNMQQSNPAGHDVTLTSSADASPRYPGLEATEDRIAIVGAPPLVKIAKQSSIHYQGDRAVEPDDANTPNASSGNPSYRSNAQQPIRHNTIIRDTVTGFEGLLQAMCDLREQADTPLVNYSVVQPDDRSQLARAIGEPCWNFLGVQERKSGRWPRIGWELVGEHGRRVPRTALVLRTVLRDQEGYWIEIEPRTSNDSMCSPLLLGLAGNLQETLSEVLEEIAKQSGHNLQEPLERVVTANGGGRVRCFRHRYAIHDGESKWSVDALQTFLINASSSSEQTWILPRVPAGAVPL